MRYDIKVVMVMEHSLAIEAPTPGEAMAEALQRASKRDPERVHTTVEVERGAQ